MKLIFAVLDVSLTMGLTRCYKTVTSYAVQFWPAQYCLEKRNDVFARKYRLCSNAFCTVV